MTELELVIEKAVGGRLESLQQDIWELERKVAALGMAAKPEAEADRSPPPFMGWPVYDCAGLVTEAVVEPPTAGVSVIEGSD